MQKSKSKHKIYVHKTYIVSNTNEERPPTQYIKEWTIILDIKNGFTKSSGFRWVRWIHRDSNGEHCQPCLMLNNCWFIKEKSPQCPHHLYCHCKLSKLSYNEVVEKANSNSDYSKFDPYLFNTNGKYSHNKEILFNEWGYPISDAKWLQAEIEKQGLEKYIFGDYELGVLNDFGQRINIRIEIPHKYKNEIVSFISGWMVLPNGEIKLNTPYGGK